MKNQLTNMIIGFACFIIIVAIGIVIFIKMNPLEDFEYSVYEERMDIFKQNDSNYLETQEKLKEYIEYVEEHEEPDTINDSIYEVIPETNQSTSFVTSSNEQLSEMAELVIEEGKKFFGEENIKILNIVYAPEERVSVYLESPRSYLFYPVTENQEEMVGMIVTPTEAGYDIESLWGIEESRDVEFVAQEVNRLLFIYTNKVN